MPHLLHEIEVQSVVFAYNFKVEANITVSKTAMLISVIKINNLFETNPNSQAQLSIEARSKILKMEESTQI